MENTVGKFKITIGELVLRDIVLESDSDEAISTSTRGALSRAADTILSAAGYALEGGELAVSRRGRRAAQAGVEEAPRRRGRRGRREKEGRKRAPRGQGITAAVNRLLAEGYFSEYRTIADVRQTLMERDVDLEGKNIAAALKYLMERGQLTRAMQGEVYAYHAVEGTAEPA